jgi:hypothetical protein
MVEEVGISYRDYVRPFYFSVAKESIFFSRGSTVLEGP